MTPTEPPPMDRNVSFLEFVKAYYPHVQLTEEQAQQIEEVRNKMNATGNPVTREQLMRTFLPQHPRTLNVAALRASVAARQAECDAFLKPAPAEARKRWETPAAYAKRMRKRNAH